MLRLGIGKPLASLLEGGGFCRRQKTEGVFPINSLTAYGGAPSLREPTIMSTNGKRRCTNLCISSGFIPISTRHISSVFLFSVSRWFQSYKTERFLPIGDICSRNRLHIPISLCRVPRMQQPCRYPPHRPHKRHEDGCFFEERIF